MNKKVLGIAVVLMAIAMLAAPVMAKPTQGNKVAVTVQTTNMTIIDPNAVEVELTGPVAHVYYPDQHFDVTISFDDHPEIDPLTGTADVERKLVAVPQPNKGYDDAGDQRWIFTDYYVFDFGDGGFEGNGKTIIDGATLGTAFPWEKTLMYGLFKGTGDFEGQTLNIGHTWARPEAGPAPFTGYWLKYQG